MPKFKLKVDHSVTLFSPAGTPGAMLVEPGSDPIEAPGELVTERKKTEPPLPEDAYIVVNNGEEKAWPHSLWEQVEDKKKTEPAKAPAVKEN